MSREATQQSVAPICDNRERLLKHTQRKCVSRGLAMPYITEHRHVCSMNASPVARGSKVATDRKAAFEIKET